MRKPIVAAIAALAMLGASSAAFAQSAAPLSIAGPLSLQAGARTGADLNQPSDIRGGFILPTVLGIIALIYVLTKNGNDSVSP